MDLICPECMGTLESFDGQTARCTTHGGEYRVLFLRRPVAVPTAAPVSAAPAADAMCAQHPTVPATKFCSGCGKAMCDTCAFDQPDGSSRCPQCVQTGVSSSSPAIPPRLGTRFVRIPEGVRCVQHPQINATAQCKSCGAFMCDTCKFDLPGGLQLCPTCATNPKTTLSPKRKKMLIGSFALAAWCTVVMVAMFAGAFHGMADNKAGEQALGILLSLILLGPSITGVALGVGVMDRRLNNTPAMWIAVAWNGLILGGFILLMIIGMFSG